MILPLTIQDVSFEIGGIRLIKDLNCTLEAGPRTMILGANGAGKSLFLRLCHGLIRPTTGRVLWQGAKGRDPADAQAMVFQRPVMLRRSVAANVDYALKLRGMAAAERRAAVEDALGHTGLRRLADNPARVLSVGEQQKLALARAWALQPEVPRRADRQPRPHRHPRRRADHQRYRRRRHPHRHDHPRPRPGAAARR